jgi:hypothetical protein
VRNLFIFSVFFIFRTMEPSVAEADHKAPTLAFVGGLVDLTNEAGDRVSGIVKAFDGRDYTIETLGAKPSVLRVRCIADRAMADDKEQEEEEGEDDGVRWTNTNALLKPECGVCLDAHVDCWLGCLCTTINLCLECATKVHVCPFCKHQKIRITCAGHLAFTESTSLSLNLFLRPVGKPFVPIAVDPDWPQRALRGVVAHHTGIPPEQQRLVHSGRALASTASALACPLRRIRSLSQNSTIHVFRHAAQPSKV